MSAPGPYIPKREPALGAGVNNDVIEMRSRLMDLVLRNGVKNRDDVIDFMDRMELGPDFDQEDES